jgi:hypothetical protein
MSQSNVISSINENSSPTTTTKKPLALVQPVVRDLNRRLNSNQIEKANPLIQHEPLSYVSQPRKMPTQYSHDQR